MSDTPHPIRYMTANEAQRLTRYAEARALQDEQEGNITAIPAWALLETLLASGLRALRDCRPLLNPGGWWQIVRARRSRRLLHGKSVRIIRRGEPAAKGARTARGGVNWHCPLTSVTTRRASRFLNFHQARHHVIIGIPKESFPGERRVALVPAGLPALLKSGNTVLVEPGAGVEAGFPDAAYSEKGATLASRAELFAQADIVAMVHGPGGNPAGAGDLALLRAGQTIVALLDPLADTQYRQRAIGYGKGQWTPRQSSTTGRPASR